MPPTTVNISSEALRKLQKHLLPRGGMCEEAAFLFARSIAEGEHWRLEVVEVQCIPPEGFASRSRFYLELLDETRAQVIKHAHDLGAALIECHSHPAQRGACFSWSDLHGFDEFVPHVLWRLPSRPYGAIVLAADSSFDAIVWHTPACREPLRAVVAGGNTLPPTGLTITHWEEIYDHHPL